MVTKIKPFFHPDWWKYVEPVLSTPEGVKPVEMYSAAVKAKEYIRPGKPKDLFNVYQLAPDKIKVVIVGQDPYNTGHHAHGYSFSTLHDPTYSLQIILKEVYRTHFQDKKIGGMGEVFCCGDLRQWAEQGVFLLNTILSVGKVPESHADWGWQKLTHATIKAISDNSLRPVVFMLWGNKAKELKPLIEGRHHIIEAHHPASERYGKKFVGNDCFKEADVILKSYNYHPINWGVWPTFVESFKIMVGPEWSMEIPYYFKKFFFEEFGKDWRVILTQTHETARIALDGALCDSNLKRFAFDNKNLYPEKENFEKLLWLMKRELLISPARQIWIDENIR